LQGREKGDMQMTAIPKLACIAFTSFVFCLPSEGQWLRRDAPTRFAINAVSLVSDSVGWIAFRDSVAKSTDGGISWSSNSVGASSVITGLYFVDENVGYASGGKASGAAIYRTTDGGTTWEDVSPGKGTFMSGIYFCDRERGWAFGQDRFIGRIMSTSNAGVTWSDQFTDTVGYLLSGFFVDSLTGWAVGDDVILKTSDGGGHWFEQDTAYTGPASTGPFRSVTFVNKDTGWVVGGIANTSVLASTTDGGETWSHMVFELPTPLYDVDRLNWVKFVDDTTGWMVGRSTVDFNGLILFTKDGGATFTRQDTGTLPVLQAIDFADKENGWAVGESGAFLTTTTGGVTSTDGHTRWRPLSYDLSQNYPNPFNSSTTLDLELPTQSTVTMELCDILGRRVRELISSESYAPGQHHFHVEADGLASGIYILRLISVDNSGLNRATFIGTRKLTLIR
jgi:photosystem II stability/assembly factor-like uncharacterized protein